MKTLSDNLKQMLNGLSQQDAAEYLPMREKMKILGIESETRSQPSPAPRTLTKRSVTRRIAFISDGRGMGAPLAYAIDACIRLSAKIDLLTHGTLDTTNITALQNQIRAAGLDYRHIPLGLSTLDDMIDYIRNHISLVFLVAMQDNNAVRLIMEEELPKRGTRLPIPLVLIEGGAKEAETHSLRESLSKNGLRPV